MGRFYGAVGYAESVESSPGVWSETITERFYSGDALKVSRRMQSSEYVHDNLVVNTEISIVSDPYADLNFSSIRYVRWMGVKWKVSNITVNRPRLTLTLGEVYNV